MVLCQVKQLEVLARKLLNQLEGALLELSLLGCQINEVPYIIAARNQADKSISPFLKLGFDENSDLQLSNGNELEQVWVELRGLFEERVGLDGLISVHHVEVGVQRAVGRHWVHEVSPDLLDFGDWLACEHEFESVDSWWHHEEERWVNDIFVLRQNAVGGHQDWDLGFKVLNRLQLLTVSNV